MSANLLPALGFVVAAVATGLAVYFWNRARGLYALLVEGANRYEELRNNNRQLDGLKGKLEERLGQHRETIKRLEGGVDEAREKSQELLRNLEAKDHELQVVREKLSLQKTHLERQLQKVSSQLEVSEAERATLSAKAAAGQKESQRQVASHTVEIKRLGDDLAKARAEHDKAKQDWEKRLAESDPAEMKRLRRKLHQYDRLYQSMKGLKEMAEERSENWEIALRKLAAHVLTAEGRGIPQGHVQVGPLVASALGAIGAQIIEDADVQPPMRGDATPGAVRADLDNPNGGDHNAAPSDSDPSSHDAPVDAAP